MATKYLITIAVIAAAWFGFKWLSRMQSSQTAARVDRSNSGFKWPSFKQRRGEPAAQDMEPCPRCGAYVARGTGQGCGRADCPMGA